MEVSEKTMASIKTLQANGFTVSQIGRDHYQVSRRGPTRLLSEDQVRTLAKCVDNKFDRLPYGV